MGDVHYWEVWHASKPFDYYERQRPRFMSEYGFQSFPLIETVRAYALPPDHDIQSPVMLAHQKHPRGNQLIREYMLRDFPEPKDFESFLYASQVLQAEGIKVGAEHLRRIMPHNMGSLYWQLDDCWPVASWSSVDYFGRWKALQYYARRFYGPVLLSPHVEEGQVKLYVVSDRTEPLRGQLHVRLMEIDGRVISDITNPVEVAPLTGKVYQTLPAAAMLEGHDPARLFLHCELLAGGNVVSSNTLFFRPFKDLSLPAPHVTTQISRARGATSVTLSTDTLARAVYLSTPGLGGSFADNFFDLLPGRKVTVAFRADRPFTSEDLRRRLRVRTLSDAFEVKK
jgi:beta-mannosidase